jgi:hypothetical protein
MKVGRVAPGRAEPPARLRQLEKMSAARPAINASRAREVLPADDT